MDIENLVEKITQEVMTALNKKGPAQAPVSLTPELTGSGSTAAAAALLVLSGDEEDALGFEKFWKKVKSYGKKIIVLAPDKILDLIKPLKLSDEFEFISLDRGAFIERYIDNVDLVVFPIYSPGNLSKLALLLDDYPQVRIVLRAREKGKEIIILKGISGFWSSLPKIEGYWNELVSMGIKLEAADQAPAAEIRELAVKSMPAARFPLPQDCSAKSGECSGCGLCPRFIGEKVTVVMESGADRISSSPGAVESGKEVAGYIDHTLLKADATREEVIKLCEEAKKFGFASVCINPSYVKLSAECLSGTPVKVCTVIGFPLGATTSVTKAMETRDAIANGAEEIDMVINVGALKAGNYDLVKKDVEAVVQAAEGKIVKVIIEAALLTDEEKIKACLISREAGADFVKTSTGFGPGGATAHDVELMRQTVGKYMGVKASGGIRDFETAQKMIKAGATRIGASASVAIVKGEGKKGQGY